MHKALSYPRFHQPTSHLIAQYLPDSARGDAYVRVHSPRGPYFRNMGVADRENRIWLLPEEAIYLIERGNLDIRWPADLPQDGREEDNEHVGELPMSLQGAYAALLGKAGLTLERYNVYAGLRRSGYTVQRALTWYGTDPRINGHARPPDPATQRVNDPERDDEHSDTDIQQILDRRKAPHLSPFTHIIHWLLSFVQGPIPPHHLSNSRTGPLVTLQIYRSYAAIYRQLALIPHYARPKSPSSLPAPISPYVIHFNVWKPSTAYSKRSPPTPDFRLCVLDARAAPIPSQAQIGALLDSMPDDELPEGRRIEQRAKHGKRNVILAIVDTGVVSYLRFGEAGFGEMRLFEQKSKMGPKRGGQRGRGGKR